MSFSAYERRSGVEGITRRERNRGRQGPPRLPSWRIVFITVLRSVSETLTGIAGRQARRGRTGRRVGDDRKLERIGGVYESERGGEGTGLLFSKYFHYRAVWMGSRLRDTRFKTKQIGQKTDYFIFPFRLFAFKVVYFQTWPPTDCPGSQGAGIVGLA